MENKHCGGGTMETVAVTILNQLQALTPRPVIWSWGASKFQQVNENQVAGIGEDYLGGMLFFVRGALHRGHVLVSLSCHDTYTVSIGHVKLGCMKVKKQIKGVYFDEMGGVIDSLVETK